MNINPGLTSLAPRHRSAAFAQTPATGFTPSSGNPYYDSSHVASVRARAFYTYDPAGRVLSVDHWWDTWGYLVGNACSYEIGTGSNRGLKTGDTYLKDVSGSAATAWTQSYGYDSNFDYLTSASYGDSQPNASQSWTYDAAGNRTSDYTGSSWAYDNLNRMTANGVGTSCSNDVLGNRTALGTGSGATTYTWDCLNRMTASVVPGSSPAHNSYTYRADGMRVEKILHSGLYPTPFGEIDDVYARYRYDGQMPMETYVIKADSSTVLMENGLGARGIDYGTVTNSSGTTVHFPIYDAHGNEVASLSRSGSSYSLSNQRSYGAWGEVRQGNTTGGPRGRYCGNLGHVQDDETGLVYMRARYYEPGSGRFISQDSSHDWGNWFCYAENNPVGNADQSGEKSYGAGLLSFLLSMLTGIIFMAVTNKWLALTAAALTGAVLSATDLLANVATPAIDAYAAFLEGALGSLWRTIELTAVILSSPEEAIAEKSQASAAVIAVAREDGTIMSFLVAMSFD